MSHYCGRMFLLPADKKRFSARRLLKGAAFTAVAIGAVAVGFEMSVRAWAPQELISDVVLVGGPICHRLAPAARGVQRSPEYAVDIQISEQGLRDQYHPYEKRGDVFRILLLGDSHAFGWGVAMDEAFPQVLEHSLNAGRIGAPIYEVINSGTMGFGTGHQYQYLNGPGLRFDPDLVVLAVDLVHDVIANNQRFTIQGGRPTRNAVPCVFARSRSITSFIPFAAKLRGHSHAFRFAGTHGVRVLQGLTNRAEAVNEPPATARLDLTVTQGIVQSMKAILDSLETDLAVVVLPEFRDHEKEDLRDFETFLRLQQIAHTSLGAELGDGFFPSELTFQISPHFNPAGHRLLAEKILLFLENAGKI